MAQSAPLGDALPVPKGRSVARTRAKLKVVKAAETGTSTSGKDYFIQKDGQTYAGSHLLIDLWGATNLDKIKMIEDALREATMVCGATLLHIHLHEFTPNGGISGVAVLAESHISVHTWPERSFAAFDVFMCGACQPELAIPVLRRYFEPARVDVTDRKRGLVE
jgi:S-adenosylmethionine decarboxylase